MGWLFKPVVGVVEAVGNAIGNAINDLIGSILWSIYSFLLIVLSIFEYAIRFIAGLEVINGKNFVQEIISNKAFEALFNRVSLLAVIISFSIFVIMLIISFSAKRISMKIKETAKNSFIGLLILLIFGAFFMEAINLTNKVVFVAELVFTGEKNSKNSKNSRLANVIFFNSLSGLSETEIEMLKELNGNETFDLYTKNFWEIKKVASGKISVEQINQLLADLDNQEIKEIARIDASDFEEAQKTEMKNEIKKNYFEMRHQISSGTVKNFNISFGGNINYILVFVEAILILYVFLKTAKEMVYRIFVLISSYIFAIIFASFYALDNGARFKQLLKKILARLLEVVVFIGLFNLLLSIVSISSDIINNSNIIIPFLPKGIVVNILSAAITVILFLNFTKIYNMFVSMIESSGLPALKKEKSFINNVVEKTPAGMVASEINKELSENNLNAPDIAESLNESKTQVKTGATSENISKVNFNKKASIID